MGQRKQPSVIEMIRGTSQACRSLHRTGRWEWPRPAASLPKRLRQPRVQLGAADKQCLRDRLGALVDPPFVSLLVPLPDAMPEYLGRTLDSLNQQIYTRYEVLLVELGPLFEEQLRQITARFGSGCCLRRISAPRDQLAHEALNSGVTAARGDFLAVVHPGDELTPDALLALAEAVASQPADVLYSDEDKIDEQQHVFDPFHKPTWSPELLLCQHYIGHLSAFRKNLVTQVGGIRPSFGTAWEHDLALRACEQATHIIRIPRVLYHRRAARHPMAEADTLAVVQEGLRCRQLQGTAQPSPTPGICHLRLQPRGNPRVSIIILTRDRARCLLRCVNSIRQRTQGVDYEIVIVDNGSMEAATRLLFRLWSGHKQIRVLRHDIPFNFSALNNFAARVCQSPWLVFLNNDTEVISAHWLATMVAFAQQAGVGAVGAKLYFYNDLVQHAGSVIGLGYKPAAHAHKFFPRRHPGYCGQLHAVRNVSAVTAACLLSARDIFWQVGGFDENLAVAYNDVDYCLALRAQSARIVWTPEAELYHYESVSRGADKHGDARYQWERAYMRAKWGAVLDDDPYYNPNLSREVSHFALRAPAPTVLAK